MDHDRLVRLKGTHPTLRLLGADHMPLIVGFLDRAFLMANLRSIGHHDLVAALDDHLHALRDGNDAASYPRSARQYLDDWTAGPTPWLRKFYAAGSDEPSYDLTPATERAIEWLRSLDERAFVGTESRLFTLFEQLRELALRTSADVEERLAALRRRRAEIDAEMARVSAGEVATLDSTQVRERYYQAEDTARKLLSDFRQVEQNFRALDAATRERIALVQEPRGGVLEQVFGESDVIWASDQGRSFRAFWDYLLSPRRQAELRELIDRALALPEVAQEDRDPFLDRVAGFLVGAAEGVYGSTSQLVGQLRRFLTDRSLRENRRLYERIHEIERLAIALRRSAGPADVLASIDAVHPGIDLPLEHPLYSAPRSVALAVLDLVHAAGDPDLSALYDQEHVDRAELIERIRAALGTRAELSLGDLAGVYPLRQGLAELVAYLAIATGGDTGFLTRIDDARRERIRYLDPAGAERVVDLPEVRLSR
jgi:flagellar motility protein MotE (MotC chaperone)